MIDRLREQWRRWRAEFAASLGMRTTTAMRRDARFCWYRRLESVVTKTSRLSFSAASNKSPFLSFAQPRS